MPERASCAKLIATWRRSQVVRQGSAKPRCMGSNPIVASSKNETLKVQGSLLFSCSIAFKKMILIFALCRYSCPHCLAIPTHQGLDGTGRLGKVAQLAVHFFQPTCQTWESSANRRCTAGCTRSLSESGSSLESGPGSSSPDRTRPLQALRQSSLPTVRASTTRGRRQVRPR